MNIVFFGSSDFSLPTLQSCLSENVILVVTTPDREKGRGLKTESNPVKIESQQRGLNVLSPEKLRDPALLDQVKAMAPDLYVVASYGKIIPESWLTIPKILSINVHPSLIPKYRGAAPVNWPLLNGDTETGITLMDVSKELDAGDIYLQERCAIDDRINAKELSALLAQKAASALLKLLRQIKSNEFTRTPQNHADATYARKLTKEDGLIHWDHSALQIARQVRGLYPWPMAFTQIHSAPLQILEAEALSNHSQGIPGSLTEIKKQDGFAVQTGDGELLIRRVKPAGKKEMSALDFINGLRAKPGYTFGV